MAMERSWQAALEQQEILNPASCLLRPSFFRSAVAFRFLSLLHKIRTGDAEVGHLAGVLGNLAIRFDLETSNGDLVSGCGSEGEAVLATGRNFRELEAHV